MSSTDALESLSKSELIRLIGARDAAVAALSRETATLKPTLAKREERITELERENAWFRKQLFGQKSERRLAPGMSTEQLRLGELPAEDSPPPPDQTVRAYQRTRKAEAPLAADDTKVRFDPSVPVETISVPDPRLEGLSEGADYEVIREITTDRLAQRPGSYVVLRYVRKVVKLKSEEVPSSPPASPAVIERSVADVSFLAGLLIDKFTYHLPLYRQHQRLKAAGAHVSRQTLTNLVFHAVTLLEPVYYAQLSSILLSKVLAMDETPIKAGRKSPGKLNLSYFWPLYGDQDEVAFPYSPTRAHATVQEILGSYCGTLLTDGYEAYDRFATRSKNVVLAQCWAHTRRNFVEAELQEPGACAKALDFIAELYANEEAIRAKNLTGEEKLHYRVEHSKPIVDLFFLWLTEKFGDWSLLSSSPFTKAASYALERQRGLSVFLSDPDVAIDTNHLERALRAIPMGRKNWLFPWTEVGAEIVGKIQSLLVTCRLHDIDPYTYLVDVLQRIDSHPALDVEPLTPQLWKQHFAGNPLHSHVTSKIVAG
jgi:transposase